MLRDAPIIRENLKTLSRIILVIFLIVCCFRFRICVHVDTQHFGENGLTGKIPDFFEHTSRLQELGLEHNKFTGTIPPNIGKLTGLSK